MEKISVIGKSIKGFFSIHKKIILIIIVCMILNDAIVYSIGYAIGKSSQQINTFSISGKRNQLEQSYNKYINMTAAEIHLIWLETFKDYKYQTGGDELEQQTDCLRSCLVIWKRLGSNIETMTIPVMMAKINKLADPDIRLSEIRKSIKDVKTNDLIFFKPIVVNGRQYYHVGIVESVVNGWVKYCDFNSAVGSDFPRERWDSGRILMIAQMPLKIWQGNIQ